MTAFEGGDDINLLDLSGLTELTIRQMQDRVALAEEYSFAEHNQKGRKLMTLRRKEKKAIKKVEDKVRELIQFKLCDLGDFPDMCSTFQQIAQSVPLQHEWRCSFTPASSRC